MQDQEQFLRELGLDPHAPGLVAILPDEPIVAAPALTRAPFPADAHTMAVTAIPWTDAWLDGFPNLEGPNMAAASRYLFDQFKSAHRDRDRHSLLHRDIGRFISRVRAARLAGTVSPVTDRVRAGRPARDMAAALQAAGVTEEELAAFLARR